MKARKTGDKRMSMLYMRAFNFKVICVIAYTVITHFYFKGGDTALYYQATKDLRAALSEDVSYLKTIITSSNITLDNPLAKFFIYDGYEDITVLYMASPPNFAPAKIALLPSLLFGNSFICINMFFGFISLGGAIRLFKAFHYFYPKLRRELAIACLFLPGVAFWSAGLLKDPITFACVGFILYALVKIIFIKKDYFSSFLIIFVSVYFLLNIKVYILLVLVLSILVWIFAELNKIIKDKTLRILFSFMTFGGSIVLGFIALEYLTALQGAQEFKLDTLMENAEAQRKGFENISQRFQGDSYFKINASNPVSFFFASIVATLFRPFLWEINTPVALLSALESFGFLLITVTFFKKKGIWRFFTTTFSDGRILMAFVFTVVFAFAIGSSTANFGALSRYKIPCTPFYMVFIILLFNKVSMPLPRWFNSIVNFAVPKPHSSHVRHSRIS